MGSKKEKTYKDIKKINPIDPKLLKMLKSIKADLNRKSKVGKAYGGIIRYNNGDLVDVSRGQAGYDFKGIF